MIFVAKNILLKNEERRLYTEIEGTEKAKDQLFDQGPVQRMFPIGNGCKQHARLRDWTIGSRI